MNESLSIFISWFISLNPDLLFQRLSKGRWIILIEVCFLWYNFYIFYVINLEFTAPENSLAAARAKRSQKKKKTHLCGLSWLGVKCRSQTLLPPLQIWLGAFIECPHPLLPSCNRLVFLWSCFQTLRVTGCTLCSLLGLAFYFHLSPLYLSNNVKLPTLSYCRIWLRPCSLLTFTEHHSFHIWSQTQKM